jgi:cation transport ATPase
VPVQFWCGLPFLRSAWARARARATNMDTLIALSTLASFVYSTVMLLSAETAYSTASPSAVQHAARLRHGRDHHRGAADRALV